MLTIHAVHFDDFIPNWRTHAEVIGYNVLVLVLEGRVCYRIGAREHVGEPGDLLFIPRGTRRAGDNHVSGPHRKYTVLFNDEEDPMSFIPFLRDRQWIRHKPRKLAYIQRRFERLHEEWRLDDPLSAFAGLGILRELISLIARDLERPEVPPIKTRYAEAMQRYLRERYREPVATRDLARLIGRSPNYAIAVFREVTGQTPIAYMHQLRVAEACRLLLNSDMTIASIADYLGYYDPSYFFRVFKKHASMTPSDYVADGNRGQARLR
ncbi:helix-turn-helix domain-containing protein [Paenibacillus aurantiacus]|uniref:Helix-turn-helix domain-containing protein n=1 Tax=Paenibacillus aurantiacus TaxID=1936118 RepID=A0ABV5KME4_9BACL